jgi:hypothetical protein
VSIENPYAVSVDAAVRAGIGPGNPSHPYHNVYWGPDGLRPDEETLAVNIKEARVVFAAFGFPMLNSPMEGVV